MIPARLSRHLVGLVFLLLATGCKPQVAPVTQPATSADLDLFAEDGQLTSEVWEAHYVRDSKLGHRHTRTLRLVGFEPPLIKTIAVDRLELRRFQEVNQQELTIVSVETESGELRRCGYRLISSGNPKPTVAELEVHDDETADLTKGDGDEATTVRIRWGENQQGVFAIQRSLRRAPMHEGEVRRVEVFVPLSNHTATFQLTARGIEQTDVSGAPRSLMRIEAVDTHPDSWRIPSSYWTDESGAVIKMQEAFMQRRTVVVDQPVAMASNDLYRMDFGIDTGVSLKKPIRGAQFLKQAVYRVQLDGLEPAEIFPAGLSQRVLPAEPGVAMVTVRSVSPSDPPTVDVTVDPPTPDDLAPNPLIESDDPSIIRIADAIVADDPWRAAVQVERYLHGTIDETGYSQVFDSAAQVERKKAGDCSEHAVLLAAVCRAKQIPARVVVGLVYDSAEQGFLYHMWNEVWIADRWLPLDATRGNGGIGAGYLKLRDSSLAHQNAYSMVSPVIYLMDRLKIEYSER